MKMATATENRQYISIIDNDKISKSKAMQNLNNNNPVSTGSWTVAPNGRRSRNDSINNPGWLHNSLTDDLPTGLDCILNDCMWNISDEGFCKSEYNEFDALIGSFNSDSDPVNSNSTSTFSVSCGVQRRETGPEAAESSAAHLAASGSLPPSPSSTCTSGESESASYALSILDDLEPLSVEDVDRYFTESLDVAQLHRIFTSPRRSSDSALWNDEITVPIGNSEQRPVDVRPKAAVAPPMRRQMATAVRPRTDFGTLKNMLTPQRALKRPPTGNDDYAAASKMRRTVAASAARLGCAMSGGAIDCEVVIREDEHEAIEQVEVEYEVSGDVETDYEQVSLPARVSVTPRLLPIRAPGRVQPRVAPGSMQPLRGGVAKLQRTASGNLVGVNSRLTYGNPAFVTQRAASYGPQAISRASAFAGAPFNRQTFGPGRMPMGLSQGQDSPYGIAAGRLPGRPPKRMSLPSAVSGSSTQSDCDGESTVSMNAPRRGSSSYCSQMERNRRREMNTALAALRRLILEDDRSLLSKVYAKSQLNRRNTSMIMTLRAAHDTVLKLNDNARRALEERNEQARRRERLLKRLQQLQATQQPQSQQTHVQPAAHMTLLSAKSDWSV